MSPTLHHHETHRELTLHRNQREHRSSDAGALVLCGVHARIEEDTMSSMGSTLASVLKSPMITLHSGGNDNVF